MFFKRKRNPGKKKSALKEWLNAAVFALIAATITRTFIAEAYAIPSGSMEGTLLTHDHLFVNKLAYGPRIPMTPFAVPLVYNTLPITGGKSYSEAVQWKYHRLPGFGKVKRNDIVVFNAPDGDTAIADDPELDYYQLCRMYGRDAVSSRYTIVTRPLDKKENLIKRCIGLPGDVLELRNASVYINGRATDRYPHARFNYIIKTRGMAPPVDEHAVLLQTQAGNNTYVYNMEQQEADALKSASSVVSVDLLAREAGKVPVLPGAWVFPFDTTHYKWNADNYGPVTIPRAGMTVALTSRNIALYRRIIKNYEGNTLEEKDGRFIINGREATAYTFKMDYYWMMGDNRDNSLDSRYWGFVPEDHIVGKAWFVWFSYADHPGDIRWERLLRGVKALE